MNERLRLWADFNEVYDDACVWTSLRASLRRFPEIAFQLDRLDGGDWVELFDGEGSTCWGVVANVEYPIVHVKLDWGTWSTVSTNLARAGSGPDMGAPVVTGDQFELAS